jgi:ADP-ribosylglycohydrolase
MIDKIKGVIYGQAIGDALGLGSEFMDDKEMAQKYPNGLKHYSDIYQDAHRSRWRVGEWTDDTDMMLCIANALVKDKGVDLSHIARNFKQWAEGEPMGIGLHTYKVLMIGDYVDRPQDVSKLVWEMSRGKSAANGGLMRTSIVGALPNEVEKAAADICRLTHYDPRCVGSCVIVSELIHSLIYDSQPISYQQMVEIADRYDERIKRFISLSREADIKALELQDEHSMGYTLKTLAAALWAYWNAKSFEDGLLAVVNAGGDADTNAAVACAILEAKYGYSSLPKEYIEGLIHREHLDEIAIRFMELLNVNSNYNRL